MELMERMGVDMTETEALLEELNLKNTVLEEKNQHLLQARNELQERVSEITAAQQEAAVMAERYRLATDASRDVIWDWDGTTNIFYASDRIGLWLGEDWKRQRWNLDSLESRVHPEDFARFIQAYSRHIQGRSPFFAEDFRLRSDEQDVQWLHVRGIAQKDSSGRVVRAAGSLTEITEHKQQEQKLQQLAYTDPLTGLPNTYWLKEKLASTLAQARRAGQHLELYCIGLDELKRINDLMGNRIGDVVLQTVAKRLMRLGGAEAEVARLDGDEFLLIRRRSSETLDMQSFGEALIQAVREPVWDGDVPIYVTGSVGIATDQQSGETSYALLKHGQMAMAKAKEAGKNTLMVYSHALGEEFSNKTRMSQQLRIGVANHEFYLVFQPVVSLSDDAGIGFEALLRWNSPVYGSVGPSRFIPLAEENGAILELGMEVIHDTFRFIQRTGRTDIAVSCNISARQLQQADFAEKLIAYWRQAKIPTGTLAIEITETIMIESLADIVPSLDAIRACGIQVYLDDFGTGYSSLTYLSTLPIDVVKLDKAFVQGMVHSGHEEKIIRAVISLAHEMGKKVIAEGVETEEQRSMLKALGCDAMQGYLVSVPVSELEALAVIKEEKTG